MTTDQTPRSLDDLTRDLRARTVRNKVFDNGAYYDKTLPDGLAIEAADAIDRLLGKLDNTNTIIADAKIDRLTTPQRAFDYDAIAELLPSKVDSATRFRRKIDLDGRKYSIILPENIPPAREGERPLHLVARFRRYGEAWPAADESFQNANVIIHLAEALWERVYVAPAADVEPSAPIPQGPGAAARQAFDPKQEIAATSVKDARALIRPLLKAHRLSDVFKAPAGRECICGKLVADIDGWIEHVLTILALGDEPPDPNKRADWKLSHVALVADPPDRNCRIYWDVAAKTIMTPDATYTGVEPVRGETDSEWSFEFKQPLIVSDEIAKPSLPVDWRSVPVTAGLLFDALGRVEQQDGNDIPKDAMGALSCELERLARAMAGSEK